MFIHEIVIHTVSPLPGTKFIADYEVTVPSHTNKDQACTVHTCKVQSNSVCREAGESPVGSLSVAAHQNWPKHYSKATWVLRYLISPATPLFVQLVQANNNREKPVYPPSNFVGRGYKNQCSAILGPLSGESTVTGGIFSQRNSIVESISMS